MLKGTVTRWQTNFFTGLAVVMPIVITLALVVWLFGTVSNITDTLLFFIPKRITHQEGPGGPGSGALLWNWKLLALLVGFLMVSVIGRLTRYYIGRRLFHALDQVLLSIPMLNKIYGTIKQVNDAFSSNKKSAFQQVVLVEFPREGVHSIGFVTGEGAATPNDPASPRLVNVFVPTTPNPTTGFLIMLPADKVVRLDISVAEGIKFLISLGSVPPEHAVRHPVDAPTTPPPPDSARGATEFITAAVQQAKSSPDPAGSKAHVPQPTG